MEDKLKVRQREIKMTISILIRILEEYGKNQGNREIHYFQEYVKIKNKQHTWSQEKSQQLLNSSFKCKSQ